MGEGSFLLLPYCDHPHSGCIHSLHVGSEEVLLNFFGIYWFISMLLAGNKLIILMWPNLVFFLKKYICHKTKTLFTKPEMNNKTFSPPKKNPTILLAFNTLIPLVKASFSLVKVPLKLLICCKAVLSCFYF